MTSAQCLRAAAVAAACVMFCLAPTSLDARQAGSAGATTQAPLRVGGDIREPAKLVNVPPVYPAEAKAAGIQGVIILEAVIGVDGRVPPGTARNSGTLAVRVVGPEEIEIVGNPSNFTGRRLRRAGVVGAAGRSLLF